jgi:para-nitrobenzyl esterase
MTDAATSVRVAQGELRGKADRGISAFLGIPYAAAPFGDARMLPPRPAPSWDGVRDATEHGPTCPKGEYPPQYQALFPEIVIPGEECLNLSVWTPDPGASGLPVLVWIHGGSFMNGSGSVAEYDGHAFARDGIVCVTINYRLGAEGFLYTGDGVANVGLLDQVAALRWVQDNIAAFGGDPGRVTVAGESAGAMSITTLLAMPQARGLFGQAITQSGAGAHTLAPGESLQVARYLADALGVEPDRQAIAALPADRVAQAAGALTEEVQTAPDPAKWGQLALSLLPFCPTVDGDVLPAEPLAALAAGAASDVRVLTGTNLEEAQLFLVAAGAIDLVDEAMLAGGAAGYGAPDGLVAAYQANRPGAGAGDVLAAIITDWFFRIPAVRVAEARAGNSASAGNTWMYRFDWRSPSFDARLGSCHAVELPFVFDTLRHPSTHARLGPDAPQAVADTIHSAWARFITDGDPGWPAYETGRRATAIFTEKLEVVSDPAGDERQLWEQRQPLS